jgi:hypothetical protein
MEKGDKSQVPAALTAGEDAMITSQSKLLTWKALQMLEVLT